MDNIKLHGKKNEAPLRFVRIVITTKARATIWVSWSLRLKLKWSFPIITTHECEH
jgi:hypothetical protein